MYLILRPFKVIAYNCNCQWMSFFSINPSYLPALYLQMVLCSASQSITNQKIIKQKKQPTFFNGNTKGKRFLREAKKNNICANILFISLLKLKSRFERRVLFVNPLVLLILSKPVATMLKHLHFSKVWKLANNYVKSPKVAGVCKVWKYIHKAWEEILENISSGNEQFSGILRYCLLFCCVLLIPMVW